jgi:hypothetical protein
MVTSTVLSTSAIHGYFHIKHLQNTVTTTRILAGYGSAFVLIFVNISYTVKKPVFYNATLADHTENLR